MPRPFHDCMTPRPALRMNALRLALSTPMLAFAFAGQAQSGPAMAPPPAQAVPFTDDIPLADYLGLLQQIAPAAEDGARTYLAGVRLRCGRDLSPAELRRAMAREGGDPVLIGLIRAAHQKDRGVRQQLVTQIQCTRGDSR